MEPTRYRVEAGRAYIDLDVRHTAQLFDSRDPAPFHERDLDEDAVAYLLGAAREIPRHDKLAIVVAVTDEPIGLGDAVIVEAIRAHFANTRVQIGRQLRAHVRRGRTFLAIAFSILAICLGLAEVVGSAGVGRVGDVLREGLVITGWVALWRPLEALLYDWWPLIDERRLVDRILEAPVTVRRAGGPGRVSSRDSHGA